MNWWVIFVEICLNSFHKCFVYVCMLMGFEVVWLFMKFEWKLRKLWVLVENELGNEFKVNCVIIPSLLWFWMPFDVYKLIYKFWGRIWVKWDRNGDFSMNFGCRPDRNPKSRFPYYCQNCLASGSSPRQIAQWQQP